MDFETFKQEIEDYLPIDFYNEENNTYKTYLLDALTENWGNRKYQFCILATNMLFMSYLYKGFWFLLDKNIPKVEGIKKSQESYNKPENMFFLSLIKEDKFIETYTSVFDIHPNVKREYVRLIEVRDECAHASGNIQYERDDMQSKFQEYHKAIEKIFSKHKSYLLDAFQKAFDYYLNNELYQRTCYEFFLGFCAKEKISIKELYEINNYINGFTILKETDDYLIKKLTVLFLKCYISNKILNIEYDIDRFIDDIEVIGKENPSKIYDILARITDEQTASSYQIITEKDYETIESKLNSEKVASEEVLFSANDFPEIKRAL